MRNQYHLDLDNSIIKNMRDVVTFNNFIFEYTKGGINQFGMICAVMDRVDDITDYLMGIHKELLRADRASTFSLQNFLNHSMTMIDCLLYLAEMFDVDTKDFKTQKAIFDKGFQKGSDNKDSDLNYFKYIRALISAHPVNTTRHKGYLKGKEEWCPYIADFFPFFGLEEESESNFVAIVYTDDVEVNRRIPIFVDQIFTFVQYAYYCLADLCIEAMNKHIDARTEKLRHIHIKTLEECDNEWDEYLIGLSHAAYERRGESYQVMHWRHIIRTEFKDKEMNSLFEEYKSSIKKDIMVVHERLQNMEDVNETDGMLSLETSKILYEMPIEHGYADGKIHYLRRSEEGIDDINEFSDEEDVCGYVQAKRYSDITNSEWARIQLKTMESILGEKVKFNYQSGDWHLYMQIVTAKYLLGLEELNKDS